MRKIDTLIVHCSDSPQGRGDDASAIDRWHKERGFKRVYDGKTYHIGYHYVILEDGSVETGRPLEVSGAHARGHNSSSIGVCLIGKESFTEEQFTSLETLIRGMQVQFDLEKVLGHRDVDSHKTCPNFSVGEFMISRGLIDGDK